MEEMPLNWPKTKFWAIILGFHRLKNVLKMSKHLIFYIFTKMLNIF